MSRTPQICVAIVDHSPDGYFEDLTAGLRRFFGQADVVWYDSGIATQTVPSIPRLQCSRAHEYAKITGVFFDLFEWCAEQNYDYLINLETDLAVVNPGVEVIANLMRDSDYMAARLIAQVASTSRWRPYNSLRGELPELRDILRTHTMQGAFSPAQVFSRSYLGRILESPFYPQLREFVGRNRAPDRSFTLQEVLLPTLARVCGLRSRSYPAEQEVFNRYRPYHALRSVQAARAANVPFVHPIRRTADDVARQYVHALTVSSI